MFEDEYTPTHRVGVYIGRLYRIFRLWNFIVCFGDWIICGSAAGGLCIFIFYAGWHIVGSIANDAVNMPIGAGWIEFCIGKAYTVFIMCYMTYVTSFIIDFVLFLFVDTTYVHKVGGIV